MTEKSGREIWKKKRNLLPLKRWWIGWMLKWNRECALQRQSKWAHPANVLWITSGLITTNPFSTDVGYAKLHHTGLINARNSYPSALTTGLQLQRQITCASAAWKGPVEDTLWITARANNTAQNWRMERGVRNSTINSYTRATLWRLASPLQSVPMKQFFPFYLLTSAALAVFFNAETCF